MAELSTLARPYAKAAFEYAVDAADLKGWSDSLKAASVVSQEEKVVQLLGAPGRTAGNEHHRNLWRCD